MKNWQKGALSLLAWTGITTGSVGTAADIYTTFDSTPPAIVALADVVPGPDFLLGAAGLSVSVAATPSFRRRETVQDIPYPGYAQQYANNNPPEPSEPLSEEIKLPETAPPASPRNAQVKPGLADELIALGAYVAIMAPVAMVSFSMARTLPISSAAIVLAYAYLGIVRFILPNTGARGYSVKNRPRN